MSQWGSHRETDSIEFGALGFMLTREPPRPVARCEHRANCRHTGALGRSGELGEHRESAEPGCSGWNSFDKSCFAVHDVLH